jgi:osmotically-inducible protein OsmY
VHVWNGLEVDLHPVRRPSNAELRHAVLVALQSEPHVPNGLVAVDVHGGYVSMRGALEFPLQISAAEAAVRRIGGVRGLRSELCLGRGPAARARSG